MFEKSKENVSVVAQEAVAVAPISSQPPLNLQAEQAFPYGLKPLTENIISRFLSNEDLTHFSKVNTQARAWTMFEREKHASNALLLAVVQGNQHKAERILMSQPKLLLSKKAKTQDYSGRIIEQMTPFQVALCAGDVEMYEMMVSYFNTLQNGRLKLAEQCNEIFPEGLEDHIVIQKTNIFDFGTITEAIQNASGDDVVTALNKHFAVDTALNQALADFRQAFDEKSNAEKVFNPHHVLKAFECYYNAFNNLDSWHKRDLFWRQVVGYTQRYLPACYAQAFAQCIDYIVKNKEPLKRSFDFPSSDQAIFPLGVSAGLGFDFATGGEIPLCIRGEAGGHWQSFRNLCRTKTSSLEELLQAAPVASRPIGLRV